MCKNATENMSQKTPGQDNWIQAATWLQHNEFQVAESAHNSVHQQKCN